MNRTRTLLLPGIILAGAAAAAACGGPVVTRSPLPPASPSASVPGFPAALPSSAPASSAPAPQDSSNTAPLGTTFSVTTQDNSGRNVSYAVTLVKVDQYAGLGQYESLANAADHMAAARFTITGVTGQASDDADSDAGAIGTDTTLYQPSFITVTDGPNFSSGEFTVSPGQTVSGWVAFELPPGQKITSVQWHPGLGSSAATWTVG